MFSRSKTDTKTFFAGGGGRGVGGGGVDIDNLTTCHIQWKPLNVITDNVIIRLM
jgi:hypothetical protein